MCANKHILIIFDNLVLIKDMNQHTEEPKSQNKSFRKLFYSW